MALASNDYPGLADAIALLGLPGDASALPQPPTFSPYDNPNYDLKMKLATHLARKTIIARGQSWEDRERWGRWDLMRRGLWTFDDPTDALSQAGVYVPLTARCIDVGLGQIMAEVTPDRTNLNIFGCRSKIEHLDGYAEKSKQTLRNRYMMMRPKDFPTYASLTRACIDNWFTEGNAYKITTIDTFMSPGDPTTKTLGPCEQWLDPFNVYHWDLDVNDIRQTDTSIYIPRDERQLDESGYPLELIEYIRETYPSAPTSRRNTDESSAYYSFWYLDQMVDRNLYNFWMCSGRWPGHEIPDLGDDEENWTALGEEYGFTVEEAKAAKWWHMEWIGWTLCVCQPWPVELPEGQSPITHAKMFHVPGRLLGYGAYSRTEWHERMYNKLFRAVLRYTMLLSNPPWWYNKGAIDAEFLQKMQSKGIPLLAMGQGLPLNDVIGTQQGQDPIGAIQFNAEGIEKMREQMQYHANMIKEIIGITDAVEGDDTSGTATQNANNLQQSLKTMFDYIGIIETDLMLPSVIGSYVALQQCFALNNTNSMEMTGQPFVQMVSTDPSSQAYRELQVSADDLVSLELLEFTITGSSAPGNKANQIQQFLEWSDRYMAIPGLLNPAAVARYSGEMIGIGPIDTLINAVTPELLMSKMQNIAAMFGPAGLQTYYAMTSDPQIMGALALTQMQTQGAQVPGATPIAGQMGAAPAMPGQPALSTGANQPIASGAPMASAV